MSILVDVIPDTARKYFYAIFALVGVVLGAWKIADPSATWVETALAVYAFVGTAFGATAASNVHVGKNPGGDADSAV